MRSQKSWSAAQELSDLVVDFDPETLGRMPVSVTEVEAVLAHLGDARAIRILRRLRASAGVLDAESVDNLLVRVHSELSRLGQELAQPMRLRSLLEPVVAEIRAQGAGEPIRIVDVGCGTGYTTRWLSRYGDLGADIEYIGCDYNPALVAEAQRLAAFEELSCSFEVADALHRPQPATIVTSCGLLHHFRGDALTAFFAEHDSGRTRAFVHYDTSPVQRTLRYIGAWVFHVARMRLALSRHDGVVSAMRAHDDVTLANAAVIGAPWADVAIYTPAHFGSMLINVVRPVVGLDPAIVNGVRSRLGKRATWLVAAEYWR